MLGALPRFRPSVQARAAALQLRVTPSFVHHPLTLRPPPPLRRPLLNLPPLALRFPWCSAATIHAAALHKPAAPTNQSSRGLATPCDSCRCSCQGEIEREVLPTLVVGGRGAVFDAARQVAPPAGAFSSLSRRVVERATETLLHVGAARGRCFCFDSRLSHVVSGELASSARLSYCYPCN